MNTRQYDSDERKSIKREQRKPWWIAHKSRVATADAQREQRVIQLTADNHRLKTELGALRKRYQTLEDQLKEAKHKLATVATERDDLQVEKLRRLQTELKEARLKK